MRIFASSFELMNGGHIRKSVFAIILSRKLRHFFMYKGMHNDAHSIGIRHSRYTVERSFNLCICTLGVEAHLDDIQIKASLFLYIILSDRALRI